jgi:hypothetical protein
VVEIKKKISYRRKLEHKVNQFFLSRMSISVAFEDNRPAKTHWLLVGVFSN